MFALIERFSRAFCLSILVLVFAGCGGGGGGGFSGGAQTTTATPTTEQLSITTSSLPDGTVGQAYLAQLQVQGGVSNSVFNWSISNGALPPGLQLDSAKGVIQGTPTTSGTSTFIVQVQDTQNTQATPATTQLSINVNVSQTTIETLSITTDSLPDGTVGQTYQALLDADGAGSKSNLKWSVINGTLPPGLTLGSLNLTRGLISGIPTTAGTFPLVIQVQDIQNPQATPGTQGFSIDVAASTGGSVVTVKDVQLLVSSPQLPSAGGNPVTLTALLRDVNNNTMPNVAVTFKADNDGTIQVTRGTTDSSGTAQATLSTQTNKQNRQIIVTASAGGAEDSTTVNVVGTNITISGPTSASSNDKISLALRLADSKGNAISDQTLNITSANLNDISNSTPVTDANGQATVIITAINPGDDTITVTGAGARAQQVLTVSRDRFVFITPDPSAAIQEIPLNNSYTVSVRWQKDGNPIVGQTVNFLTTRGTITQGVTDSNGIASANIQADTAGRAVITASAQGGPSTQIEVLFVATQAADLILQANPATISPTQQSTINAVVLDPNKNRVKGKTVNFTLADSSGGELSASSAVTNEFGQAIITYTTGLVGSAKDGVKVTATVAGTALQETVSLTVTQQLFVVLGTGNLINKPDSTRYSKPYNVLVTNTVGGPVVGAQVKLNIVPIYYNKGFYTYSDTQGAWVQTVTTSPPCPNEDFIFGPDDPRSGDGILDPGEDQNGNHSLDPGNVATINASVSQAVIDSVTTDNEGFGYFNVVYAQQFATWVSVELTAHTSVAGSETTSVASFVLPGLASDYTDKTVSPPGNPSPFGQSTTCTDTK